MTVFEHVSLVTSIKGLIIPPEKNYLKSYAKNLMEKVNLDKFLDTKIKYLSGGMNSVCSPEKLNASFKKLYRLF